MVKSGMEENMKKLKIKIAIYTYINGKNYVKEYNLEGIIIFEGEITNWYKKGKEYYSNGNLKFEGEYFTFIDEEANYNNFDLNGTIKKYYENGQIKVEGSYRNDNDIELNFDNKKEGMFKKYYDNGKLKFEGEYDNGHLTNIVKKYYSNGNLSFKGEYKNGLKNGKGKEYYENSQLKFEGIYLNGMRFEGKGYNNKGEIIFEIKNGNCKDISEYDKDGKLIFEGEYFNGRKWNGIVYDTTSGKNKYKIIKGCGCDEKTKDNWYFGEKYSNGFKEVQKFYSNGHKKYEGFYIGDDKWKGKKCDINGENEEEYLTGDRLKENCLIF